MTRHDYLVLGLAAFWLVTNFLGLTFAIRRLRLAPSSWLAPSVVRTAADDIARAILENMQARRFNAEELTRMIRNEMVKLLDPRERETLRRVLEEEPSPPTQPSPLHPSQEPPSQPARPPS
jgi:hypothetical protein